MARLKWRVALVAERHPGVATKTELTCIERDEAASLADLGLRLDEAKRLTAALQAEMVPAQMAALSECPQAYEACGRRLAAKGHYGVTFRSLFGEVPVRVGRLFVCPCQGEDGAESVAALDFEGVAVAPELAYVTARYAALPAGNLGLVRRRRRHRRRGLDRRLPDAPAASGRRLAGPILFAGLSAVFLLTTWTKP